MSSYGILQTGMIHAHLTIMPHDVAVDTISPSLFSLALRSAYLAVYLRCAYLGRPSGVRRPSRAELSFPFYPL